MTERRVIDPLKFKNVFWPDVQFYRQQKEIIYSVRDNDETVAPAGNQLGKDFVSAFIVLWFFCSRSPAKIVTTSVKVDQLEDVLWAEIRRLIDTARYRLPILYNHLHIRQVRKDGSLDPRSSLTGQVSKRGEGLLGRHLERGPDGEPRTMVVFDEASGVEDYAYDSTDTWAHRRLIIGNPYPCQNYFRRAVREGDRPRPDGRGYYRRIIRIKAEDSPNVRLAKAERRAGGKPSLRTLIPGVVGYELYCKRRATWDKIRQCIGLDAEFYEGAELMMFPPDWLNRAESIADSLSPGNDRRGKAMGIDTAEGGDTTCWAIVDEKGLIELVSLKTPDTSFIQGKTIELGERWGVDPKNWVFDLGGGGKEHADYLRAKGYKVRTVAFGESASDPDAARPVKTRSQKEAATEERVAYPSRRIEMYYLLRSMLNPNNPDRTRSGFAIPAEYSELRRQLAVFPIMYDDRGRPTLPPKRKRDRSDTRTTLEDMIGRSPDEADALVLGVYGMTKKPTRIVAGAL